ncbi:hypothetical protein KAI87_14520 [Myxococcota bacterium]|nr:hypothetical protein [Myxococcota bacterium]
MPKIHVVPERTTDATIKAAASEAEARGLITPKMRERMVDGRVSTYDLKLAEEMANNCLGDSYSSKAEALGFLLMGALEDKLGSQSSLASFAEAAKDVFPVLFEGSSDRCYTDLGQ